MMKKIITAMSAMLVCVGAGAQIGRTAVTRDGDSVYVSMRVAIPKRAAAAGGTTIYAPVITDGRWKVSLPAIVVRGRRAEVAWRRHEWAAETTSRNEGARRAKNGETIEYRAGARFQQWMQGARLELERVEARCGGASVERSTLTGRIIPPQPPAPPAPEPAEIDEPKPETIGELLAKTFPFVLPREEFDPDEPIRFYEDERDNALTIYYRINRHDIEPGYDNNRQTLINLMAAIEAITESRDVGIDKVVVAGFASPEGPFAFNDRLAWERAVSVKEYIMNNSGMGDEEILIFNGSLDWWGMRRAVVADTEITHKKEILELLDSREKTKPDAQAKIMERLRKMDNGAVWKHVTERIFPRLRNGAFIRVYFDEL